MSGWKWWLAASFLGLCGHLPFLHGENPKPGTVSEQEALREATRFERHKVAAAEAQLRREQRSAKPATPSSSEPGPSAAGSQSEGVREAIRFERFKTAAAQAQERKDAAARAQAKAEQQAGSRRHARR